MKTFEEFRELSEEDQPIDLVGYPEGNIIEVTPEEFDEMMELADDEELGFEIKWDDEPDYDEGVDGQWRFLNDDEELIEDWLEQRRDPVGWTAKKYNM